MAVLAIHLAEFIQDDGSGLQVSTPTEVFLELLNSALQVFQAASSISLSVCGLFYLVMVTFSLTRCLLIIRVMRCRDSVVAVSMSNRISLLILSAKETWSLKRPLPPRVLVVLMQMCPGLTSQCCRSTRNIRKRWGSDLGSCGK